MKSIDHWRKSSYFKPFVDNGTLDFARFDAANDKELRLLQYASLNIITFNL